jgi:hypothetical protein
MRQIYEKYGTLAPDTIIDLTPPSELDEHLQHYLDRDYAGFKRGRLVAGYEMGHYFIRLVDGDIKLAELSEVMDKLGYQIVGFQRLLVKKR